MSQVFIKAEHHNWGLSAVYEWQKDIFELSLDGDLHIVVQYYEPVLDCVVKVMESDIQKLRKLIASVPHDIKVNACDGTAWEFTAYNERGEQVFHRELGYIYGIEELEKIGNILRSYVPDYGDPWQEQELKWEESIKERASEMATPSQNGKVINIVMGSEPIPGKTPEEILEWYNSYHTEAGLAHAFADASNKFWWIEDEVYDYEEGTPEHKNAEMVSDAWCELMKNLEEDIFTILRNEGVTIPKTGQISVLRPFMERNGYYDGNGWWIPKDE